MIEKEIKIVNVDPLKLIKKLRSHGAIKSREGEITDRYFESESMT